MTSTEDTIVPQDATPPATVRPAGPGDRGPVHDLVRAAYREFADVLAPEHYATMRTNLDTLVATVDERALIVAEAEPSDPPAPGASQRAPASEERTGTGSRPSNAEAEEGNVVGSVIYLSPHHPAYTHVPQDWAVIRCLAVDPGLRGRGIARALTAVCLERAAADGAPHVGLHTAELMTAARTLYSGLGFVVHDEFPHLGVRFLVYRLDR